MEANIVRENLSKTVNAYRKATGQSTTAISKRFYGRGDFVKEFLAGRHTISVDRLDAMMQQFDAEWPEGHPKPTLRPIFMLRRK